MNHLHFLRSIYPAYILTVFLMVSCTVTKRVHQPGYSVQWKGNYSASETTDSPQSEREHAVLTEKNEPQQIDKNIRQKEKEAEIRSNDQHSSAPMDINEKEPAANAQGSDAVDETTDSQDLYTAIEIEGKDEPETLEERQKRAKMEESKRLANQSLYFALFAFIIALLTSIIYRLGFSGIAVFLFFVFFVLSIIGLVKAIKSMRLDNFEYTVRLKRTFGIILNTLFILISCYFLFGIIVVLFIW